MKKKLIGVLMVAGMLVFASGASAALTTTQVNAILGLLNSFGADTTTVANVKVALTGKTPTLPGGTTTLLSDTENGDSTSTVCCASFGYGAYMVKTPSTYSMVPKNECSTCISDPTTRTTKCLSGGGKKIVDDSYCKIPIITSSRPIIEIRRACSHPLAGILRNGARGNRVKYLQAVLSHEGYLKDNEIDGDFGKITKYALRKFQKAHKLFSDGVLGSHTGKIINKKIQEVCSSLNTGE